VPFPSNDRCGWSQTAAVTHVIDAVRWVLAKARQNLRGDAMTDVIFILGQRKPVSQAAVELVLKTQGRLSGNMADRSEISPNG
jgi:chromosome segregation ATPase